MESGEQSLEAEAFRLEVLAKQDDGEYGAVTGEPTVKAPDIDLLCEIELARFQAAEVPKAEAVAWRREEGVKRSETVEH